MRNWLIQKRDEKGMSQKDLGETVGVTQQAIANYETGCRRPRFETSKAIAEALNFDWQKFYESPPPKNSVSSDNPEPA